MSKLWKQLQQKFEIIEIQIQNKRNYINNLYNKEIELLNQFNAKNLGIVTNLN